MLFALKSETFPLLRTYAKFFKTLTLALSQSGRGDKKKTALLPPCGRRGWGKREILTLLKS